MGSRGFRTYKFGNITINVFTHEIVVIYIGQNRTYIKNFMRSRVRFFSRLALSSLVVLFTAFISTSLFSEDSNGSNGGEAKVLASSKDSLKPTKEVKPKGDVVAKVSENQLLHKISSEKKTEEKTVNEKISQEDRGNIARILEDEKIKNDLLASKETDYSKPAVGKELKIRRHTVKPGENLSMLAKKYGVSMDTICGSNNLRSYDLIHQGRKLRIPNKEGILYNMKRGSNLVSLSKKYKISVKKILSQNNFSNPDFIPVNAVVFIPDAKPNNIVSGFLWPTRVRRITSAYGWRRNPTHRGHREFHRGLDIAARYESVRATKYGKVTFAGWLGGYGKAVIIAHPNGWKSLYGHLSRTFVRKGQYVRQGQRIARSGNTGRSTGPHLHFELLKNGKNKNPRKYLKR